MTPWAATAFTRAGEGVGLDGVAGGGVTPEIASRKATRLNRFLSSISLKVRQFYTFLAYSGKMETVHGRDCSHD